MAAPLIDPTTDPVMRPPHSLRIVVPFLPPTSNNIYLTDWRRRKRFKSKEAKKFESDFASRVVPQYLPWISRMQTALEDLNSIFELHIDLYFPQDDVENKGFFLQPRKAQTRYKRMDTGNRLKLIADCLVIALGAPFDDSQFFSIAGRKFSCEAFGMMPQVHLFLYRTEPRHYGLVR